MNNVAFGMATFVGSGVGKDIWSKPVRANVSVGFGERSSGGEGEDIGEQRVENGPAPDPRSVAERSAERRASRLPGAKRA